MKRELDDQEINDHNADNATEEMIEKDTEWQQMTKKRENHQRKRTPLLLDLAVLLLLLLLLLLPAVLPNTALICHRWNENIQEQQDTSWG